MSNKEKEEYLIIIFDNYIYRIFIYFFNLCIKYI